MNSSLEYLRRWRDDLANLRVRERRPIEPFTARSLFSSTIEQAAGNSSDAFQLHVGDQWGAYDAEYRLEGEFEIPEAWRSKLLALQLDLASPIHQWAINTAEGLVELDGRPFHAVDRYHREILLPPETSATPKHRLSIKLWAGIHEASHSVHTLELRLLDPAIDRLCLQLLLLLDALEQLPETSPAHVTMLTAMQDATALLYHAERNTPAFARSCQAALDLLEERWWKPQREQAKARPAWQPQITATGHAHIDVAWLWRLRHSRRKAADTFSTALYHMDRYPFFVFTQSQPQLYQFVKEDEPELYERIKQKVAAGQWEPEGAMWVESDTNLPGGESLVRQFLFGQRFFRQEFGRTCKVLWLPDVFGYSPAMPQLMQGAGVEYFVTTKLSWNDTNRMPFDTFWWEGLDGSQVLAYFITAQNSGDRYYTYNAEMKPGVLARAWNQYKQKALNQNLLLAYGWGDGGGGPTREMIEGLEQLAVPLSEELPTAAPGRVADFMQRLAERVKNAPNVPRWVGELYFEYHRGTYTSQGRTKRANRLAERSLHNAEWLASLALLLTGEAYPQEELNAAWRIVLTHHFHDILPGSSIGPVYEDAANNYAEVARMTNGIIERMQQRLAERIDAPAGALVVFNPVSWPRSDLIELDERAAKTYGLLYQPIAGGRALVEAPEAPALGYETYLPQQSERDASETQPFFLVSTEAIETPFYTIQFNERGQIIRLLDKSANGGIGRELLRPGDRANVFQLFEDRPLNFDAWDIDAIYEQKQWELDHLEQAEVLEHGPLRAGVRFVWSYRDRTRIEQRLYVYAHSRRIDFVTEVEWQEQQTLLKVAFPTDIHSGRATAEVQFGNVERSTHRNTSWDEARFETCAHKWFDLSEGNYGVAMLNDCKYGYDVHGRTLRQTLLKGAVSPDAKADLGSHQFTYSLLPHEGGWHQAGVHRAAYELNNPLLLVIVQPATANRGAEGGTASKRLPASLSLVQVDAPNIVVETMKRAEDNEALIVRLYECANQHSLFRLRVPFAIARAEETNLLEEAPQAVEVSADGHTIAGAMRPYQIKTFALYPDQSAQNV